MKIHSQIENGTVRIDFDPLCVRNEALGEIYNYLEITKKTGVIIWEADPFLLRNGTIIGYYNPVMMDDKTAAYQSRTVIKMIEEGEC